MEQELRFDTRSIDLGWEEDGLRIMTVHPELNWDQEQAGYTLKSWVATCNLLLMENIMDRAQKHRTQLVLFSEYALPSSEFEQCQKIANGLPENAMCMAGLDRMTSDRWQELARGARNADVLAELPSDPYEWVNAAVIWVREGASEPYYFLQAKLEPAADEDGSGMLKANQVVRFTVNRWRLSQVICYDFIADRGGKSVVDILGENLGSTDLFIVLEANRSPENWKFHRRSEDMVKCAKSHVGGILFVNMAWKSEGSGFVFRHNLWKVKDSNYELLTAPRVFNLRYGTDIQAVLALFRQKGAAVHAFTYRSPLLRTVDDNDPRIIDYACVAPVTKGVICGDLRHLPAADYHLARIFRETRPTFVGMDFSCEDVVTEIQTRYENLEGLFGGTRPLSPERTGEILRTLLSAVGSVDDWEADKQSDAVRLLILAVSILLSADVPVDLELSVRRTIAWHPVLTQALTAHACNFTVDMVAGKAGIGRPGLLSRYLSEMDEIRSKWIIKIDQPHVCLFLQVAGHRDDLIPIEETDLSIRASRNATGLYRNDEIDEAMARRRGTAQGGAQSRAFTLSLNTLYKLVQQAKSHSELVALVKGVFPWIAA